MKNLFRRVNRWKLSVHHVRLKKLYHLFVYYAPIALADGQVPVKFVAPLARLHRLAREAQVQRSPYYLVIVTRYTFLEGKFGYGEFCGTKVDGLVVGLAHVVPVHVEEEELQRGHGCKKERIINNIEK